MPIQAINPANGQLIQKYQEMSDEEVKSLLQKTQSAWAAWSRTSFKERAALMGKVARVLREHKGRYAQVMTQEMGKRIADSETEVEKCARVCDFYATHAEEFLKPEQVETDARKSYVSFQPIGVVLAIMPWNYPFWQVFRFAAPALMAGNGVVLKHASNVPGSALAIEEIFQRAGFPNSIFSTLLVKSQKVDRIIEDPIIKAVTLTGSTPAGRAVASKAGSVLKKVVLELGGSDPYLILEDADIEKAALACVAGRLKNAGQSCIAAKRFIVVASVAKAFTERYLEHASTYTMGDPMDRSSQLSPLARFDLRDQLHTQVQKSIEKGAQCLLGGKVPTEEPFSKGAYYPSTVLTDVTKGMPAYDEELFGPVASIIVVKDEQEAIAVANDSSFGLAGAVFSQDEERAERIAREEIQTGTCFVNHQAYSDVRLPFGGIKASGYGRELSHFGIREFVNVKTISIPYPFAVRDR